ncbi:hypothetical protein MYP_4049 [Sporocytophaga myxococcoides]|uniref:Uncharacterized protein n=1 Tax=Sporocytophaga myxococcoides TaxID=153721 RepID=A0A098LK35_9BACT|nr:hypothetical protein [Sporocytophaga myxococcoides]GAL86819.1 hypothetical protein MYP_4049 [Sporocytophaga myxococcoides]
MTRYKKSSYKYKYFESYVKVYLYPTDQSFRIIDAYFKNKSHHLNLGKLIFHIQLVITYIREECKGESDPLIFVPINDEYRWFPLLKVDRNGWIWGAYPLYGYVVYFSKPPNDHQLNIALTEKPIDDLIKGFYKREKSHLHLGTELSVLKYKMKSLSTKFSLNN